VDSSESPPLFNFQARAGQAWVQFQDRLDAQLDPFGRAALARLAPQSGSRVLDVGCGTGQTLLQLAELVGPRGEVVGIDNSEPMLECAEERVREGNYAQVDLLLDDAQSHVFLDRYFDLAFSRFGLMFFEDAAAGFSNVGRALRRGGRLCFVCWQSATRNPWASVPLEAVLSVAPALAERKFLDSARPGPFHLADAERIRSLLLNAGFTKIEITGIEKPLHFGATDTVSDAVAYSLRIGPASRAIAEAETRLHSAFSEALERALSRFLTPDGVWMDAAAWVVHAERA
jgi:ubiquinone/menaquinone biosynthesis C-methylase UbiE